MAELGIWGTWDSGYLCGEDEARGGEGEASREGEGRVK